MRLSSNTRLSTVALVAGNLVPLVGVLAFGWDVPTLLLVYWLESGVLGATFAAKIRRADGEDDPEELPSLKLNETPIDAFVGRSNRRLVRFFLFHYGCFWVVHGVFVVALFGVVAPLTIGGALLGLGGYHVLSYRLNYLRDREFERSGPVTLMVEPYRRVIVMHVTVVFGGLLITAVGSPVGAVLVLVVVKTVLDLRGHWREHDRMRRRRPRERPETT